MDIKKAQWTTDGNNYSIAMPLTKVDKENRLVSGWASLDNPDLQDDIVLASASEMAFKNFRGNIREMHQPVAVGRMVEWRPDSYYDPITKNFYNGIYVTVYVSKGAQDTWEKVLDGTLQAFSIKGPITDHEMQFSKDAGKPLRIIKGYELEELSLVDSGGNQLANIMSIMKSNGSVLVKGMVAETTLETVFWCDEDGIAKTSSEESAVCPQGHAMKSIGWFECGNDKADKIADIIAKHNSSNTTATEVAIEKQAEEPANNEGGVDVAEETKTPEAGSTVPADVDADEQGKAETEVNSSTESLADNSEVQEEEAAPEAEATQEPDFAKMFGDLKESVEAGLSKTVDSVTEKLSEVTKSFDTKLSELEGKHNDLVEKINAVSGQLGDVEKRVGSVEAGTAEKMSGDLGGESEEVLTKSKGSIWSGTFLTSDLER